MSGHRVVANADIHFYSATKYAVTALTEGLRQELREANTCIRVTVHFNPWWAFILAFDKDHWFTTYLYNCKIEFVFIKEYLPIFLCISFFSQGISPGDVATEFGARLYQNNDDKAAAVCAGFQVTLLLLYPKNSHKYYKCLLITNLALIISTFYSLWKLLMFAMLSFTLWVLLRMCRYVAFSNTQVWFGLRFAVITVVL